MGFSALEQSSAIKGILDALGNEESTGSEIKHDNSNDGKTESE